MFQIPPPQYPHKYQDKLKEIEVERRKVQKYITRKYKGVKVLNTP